MYNRCATQYLWGFVLGNQLKLTDIFEDNVVGQVGLEPRTKGL